eukprot:TRINITY_DN6640_c0_g3_i3.p1 TRINITY_DN6640_c0_g3~~TRINITY_DN6640_c0_g3_i3.p1  ORF type:complete len:1077 (+),score=296.35 TRINITY_DN6640_c0_g3_i3:284-3514(+)
MNDDQLRMVNQLCQTLFQSPDASQRTQAEQQLAALSKPESIAQLTYIVDHSTEPYTCFFVSTTILRLVTDSWNAISPEQKLELRQWLFAVVAGRGAQMERHNVAQMVSALCRLTKLGWLDHPMFQELPADVHRVFLQGASNQDLVVIGLMVLNQLILEVNQVAAKRTLTQHRKTSVAFRDACLFDIFKTALVTLETIRRDPTSVDPRVVEQGLGLALACLTFDFVGIFPDDSSDDVGTVQIPSNWRPVMIDPATMQLFWDLYPALRAPRSTECLKSIVQFASVRRSLFNTEEERQQWLSHILSGILCVLKNRSGLDNPENYHEFCRLLSRIKPNYQLSELVSAESYAEWIELSARFTVESFINWQVTSSSHYFLLALWSRLISAQPYLKGEKPSRLESYVPEVTQAFVRSRLELAQAVVQSGGGMEDPLDDAEMLLSQLESVPVLARSCYEKVGPYLLSLVNPVLQEYQSGLQLQQITQEVHIKFQILESQLAWLTYIMGAIVGHHVSGSSSVEAEKTDGDTTACVFTIARTVQARQLMPGALQSESLQRLESAILYFLQSFRKVYVGESSMPCSKVYPRLHELLGEGMEDHMAVLGFIVNHMVHNLKVWRECPRLIGETLGLFCDLSSGYSSGRFLLKLESLRYMMQHHNSQEFPFLDHPINLKARTKFYKTLANLLFMETVAEGAFEQFMLPLKQVCLQLQSIQQPESFAQPNVKQAAVGVLRDLRGVCASCVNKHTYSLLFEWMFPAHMELIHRCCQVYGHDPDVTTPLLKLLADFVHNRSQRILFESSSPNGILLFKESSKLLLMYGEPRLLAHAQNQNNPGWNGGQQAYQLRYKGYSICMNVLARSLSGGYCNFGAMTHYKDDALDRAVDVVIKLALTVPVDDLLGYPKVGMAYYSLMEILYADHCQLLCNLDTPAFLHLAHSLEEAVRSIELNRQSVCSATAAVGHLASFYMVQSQKNSQYAARLNQHIGQDPDLFPRVLNSIFNVVLFEECANQWSMSRPMLPLILINPNFYNDYKGKLIGSLPPERQMKMAEAFEKLMEGIEKTLEPKNRDKFTQNLTTFRHLAKAVL